MSQVRKRCLIICPTDTWGSVEENVLLRAKELATRGHKVTVVLKVNTFEQRFKAHPDIHVERILSRPSDLRPAIYRSYRRIIRKTRPDCVFVPLRREWWAASMSARRLKVPRIVLYAPTSTTLTNNPKNRLILKRCKALLMVDSKEQRERLIASNRHASRQNTFLINPGVPTQSETDTGPRLKDRLPLPDHAWLIGCAGPLSHAAGVDLLAEILPQLPDQAHVLVAGEGDAELDLKNRLEAAEVAHRAHFVGDPDDKAPFLRSLDCFLLPARTPDDGAAGLLANALSYGLPVVATQHPVCREVLEDGRHGVLTEPDNADALADALNDIMRGEITFDPAEQRLKAANEHDLKTMLDLTEHLFFGKLNADPKPDNA